MNMGEFDGKSDKGAEMVMRHPGTGEPTDATITLAGIDSKVWRRAFGESRRRTIQASRDSNATPASIAAEVEASKPGVMATITLSWKNIERDGQAIKCTKANARKLYDEAPWLLEQVSAFVENRANFFRGADGGDASSAEAGSEGADAASPAAEG